MIKNLQYYKLDIIKIWTLDSDKSLEFKGHIDSVGQVKF